jgi:hypothetical protein
MDYGNPPFQKGVWTAYKHFDYVAAPTVEQFITSVICPAFQQNHFFPGGFGYNRAIYRLTANKESFCNGK